jgi:uncharacterized membrane protein YedE/YeeE
MHHLVAFFGVLGVALMFGSLVSAGPFNGTHPPYSRDALGWVLALLGSLCLAIGAACGV